VSSYRPVYFKYGIARGPLSRYLQLQKTTTVPTQIAYFDEVKRGSEREDVMLAAPVRQ
jgi:hypothetical protein